MSYYPLIDQDKDLDVPPLQQIMTYPYYKLISHNPGLCWPKWPKVIMLDWIKSTCYHGSDYTALNQVCKHYSVLQISIHEETITIKGKGGSTPTAYKLVLLGKPIYERKHIKWK